MSEEPDLPWDVAPEHRRDYEGRMVRCWLRRSAGLPLTDTEQAQLGVWIHGMGATVLTYSPTDGFRYAPRTDSDRHALWRG